MCVVLDANSRAQVYADQLLLERGRGQLDSGSNYRLEARTLRVMLGWVRGPWWRSAIPAPSMLDPSKEICALLMRMECASPMSGPATRSSFAWS